MKLINYFFDNENMMVATIQLLGYAFLVFYFTKSIKTFRIGLVNGHKERGSYPVLAFVYMIFSVFFIGAFIKCYELIYSANQKALLDSSNFLLDDFYPISIIFNISIIALLIAFTLNFSKSFYTINSLEFGILIINDYGKRLYTKKRKRVIIVDSFLRIIIALVFVYLEHTLSISNQLFEEEKLGAFTLIGWLAFILYVFTILWLLYNNYIDKSSPKLISDWWFWLSLFQFISGLFISIALIIIGKIHNTDHYKVGGLALSGIVFIFSFGVTFTIILNEIKLKLSNVNG